MVRDGGFEPLLAPTMDWSRRGYVSPELERGAGPLTLLNSPGPPVRTNRPATEGLLVAAARVGAH